MIYRSVRPMVSLKNVADQHLIPQHIHPIRKSDISNVRRCSLSNTVAQTGTLSRHCTSQYSRPRTAQRSVQTAVAPAGAPVVVESGETALDHVMQALELAVLLLLAGAQIHAWRSLWVDCQAHWQHSEQMADAHQRQITQVPDS